MRKEFCDYDVETVFNFAEDDIERMLKDPQMFKNRRKIERARSAVSGQ